MKTKSKRIEEINAHYRKQREEWIGQLPNVLNQKDINSLDELLNTFPFSHLPETRMDVDFSKRNVEGFGGVTLPNYNAGDSQTGMVDKDGVREWFIGFVNQWKQTPNVVVDIEAVWYNKIQITNDIFVIAKNERSKTKQAAMDSQAKKGFTID